MIMWRLWTNHRAQFHHLKSNKGSPLLSFLRECWKKGWVLSRVLSGSRLWRFRNELIYIHYGTVKDELSGFVKYGWVLSNMGWVLSHMRSEKIHLGFVIYGLGFVIYGLGFVTYGVSEDTFGFCQIWVGFVKYGSPVKTTGIALGKWEASKLIMWPLFDQSQGLISKF